jgi:DNA repair protein RecN (Recombination protein N)
MLIALSVRDVVLIDCLDLSFGGGLTVMTGETGAGKSILLDALGLAIGGRGDASLIRHGQKQAVVTIEFDAAGNRAAADCLAEHGLTADERIVLRRVLSADGRNRAFVNDEPAGVALLRELGDALIEIQTQNESFGLLRPVAQRGLLDMFSGNGARLGAVQRAYDALQAADTALAGARAEIETARADEDFVRHAVSELQALDPQDGEDASLSGTREMLRHGEKIAEALGEASRLLHDDGGLESRLRLAERSLARVAEKAAGRLDAAIERLAGASAEAAEASAALDATTRELRPDPAKLDAVEERLFALRALARKHRVSVDDLAAFGRDLAARLSELDNKDGHLAGLEQAADEARAAYAKAAQSLSSARRTAAAQLDRAVRKEFVPLKLGKAKYRTDIDTDDQAVGRDGLDRVVFEVATNLGQPFGSLARVASGGELGRIMLALKVALAARSDSKTLIFDEADRGVSGATADAVGERLAGLAAGAQVIAVTHSPQVAARGHHHLRVSKLDGTNGARGAAAHVEVLSPPERREEIARLLAGAKITNEARAAAERLIGQTPAGGLPV